MEKADRKSVETVSNQNIRIIVCVKQLPDGTLNPFDACALEAALQIEHAEITLLSMGREKVREMLSELTRLGNIRAILLTDPAFAGADTLVTARTLAHEIRKIQPDLVFCGRQTMDGDTAQVGPEIAAMLDIPVITNVMELSLSENVICCKTRTGPQTENLPVLLTIERINTLRFPSLFSQSKPMEIRTAAQAGIPPELCGLQASPTRVIRSHENQSGKRHCTFIRPEELRECILQAVRRQPVPMKNSSSEAKLPEVWITDSSLHEIAAGIAKLVRLVPFTGMEEFLLEIQNKKPDTILYPATLEFRKIAPMVAARLQTGLCADCTSLATDGQSLYMQRPAFGGNITAEILCKTRPQMATVRTPELHGEEIIFSVGAGAQKVLPDIRRLAEQFQAFLGASRKMVDLGLLPYEAQVGITGRTVAPKVYVAFGISGAVHHIAGMERSNVVIAVNSDPHAPIFEYADYGVVCDLLQLIGIL